jgi:hypothetical protein
MIRNLWRPKGLSEVQQRCLYQVRQSTRRLIETANREAKRERRDAGTTQPEDLKAVRVLRSSQRDLLNAIDLGVSGGLDLDAIRSEGIDRTCLESVVVSDLALFMLEEVSASIEARHRG